MKDKEKEKEERGAMVRALFGFWATPVMYSLIDLGVIDDLARDSREIADLADALGADVRRYAVFCELPRPLGW